MGSHSYRPNRDIRNLPVDALARGGFPCATCGKKPYPSRKIAKQAAKILFPSQRMRVYVCGPSWHLTSQTTAAATSYREYEKGRVEGPG